MCKNYYENARLQAQIGKLRLPPGLTAAAVDAARSDPQFGLGFLAALRCVGLITVNQLLGTDLEIIRYHTTTNEGG